MSESIRVLFCSASVGSGHIRAARAIAKDFPDSRILDILDFVPRWFRAIYHRGYFLAVKLFPDLVGWCYRLTDVHLADKGMIADFTDWIEDTVCHRFVDQIREESKNVDIIVSTHFLTTGILGRMRLRGELTKPIVTVVTDRHPHSIWLDPYSDLIMVANQKAAKAAYERGINPVTVFVTGIPVGKEFSKRSSPTKGMDKTVLVTGGGDGIGDIERIVKYLLQNHNLNVIVVCGNNETLEKKLAKLNNQRLKVIGYTDRMHELMQQSDILVCKPGGMTTTEGLAAGLPMILTKPVPGQEEMNAKELIECGAALSVTDPDDINHSLRLLLGDPKRLGRMRSAAFVSGNPSSTDDIVGLLKILKRST